MTLSLSPLLFVQGEVLSKIGSKHGIVDTVKTLLDRCCPMLIDSK